MKDLICDRLKEIDKLQNSIELNKLDYQTKSGKRYNFSKISFSIIFLRDIYTNVLSIQNAENEPSNLFKELSNISKGEKPIEKSLLQKTFFSFINIFT